MSTIRDTLDDAGIDVTDDVIEEGTPQDEVMKVGVIKAVQCITGLHIIVIMRQRMRIINNNFRHKSEGGRVWYVPFLYTL